MDFRADLGEEVVIVDIGAPHRLVHVGHQAYVGVAKDGAGACGIGIDAYFLRDFLPCAHDGTDILPGNAFEAAGAFQRADQRAGAEVIHEVVLVQRGLERHLGLGDVAKDDGHFRAVPQEADPGEVFAPGKEFGIDEVYILREE